MTRLMILKIMYVTQTPCTTAFAAYPKRQDVRLLKKYSFCEVYLGHVYRRQTWCLIRLLFSELSPWLDAHAPSRIIILCFFQEIIVLKAISHIYHILQIQFIAIQPSGGSLQTTAILLFPSKLDHVEIPGKLWLRNLKF